MLHSRSRKWVGVLVVGLLIMLGTPTFEAKSQNPAEDDIAWACPSDAKVLGILQKSRKVVSGLLSLVSRRPVDGSAKGYFHLRLPAASKSLATSAENRKQQNLRGLLPASVVPLDVQVETAMQQVRAREKDLDKYSLLQTYQDGSEALYYAMLMRHTRECMPLVYTPTVGQACTDWHRIYRHTPRGLYISLNDLGHVKEALQNWPEKNIQCIVVTDGERILGLGDLGSNGMGIPIGKLALYTACGGIPPQTCLPVQLDTGTNNEALRKDPAYFGLREERERGPKYDALVKEFMESVHDVYGRSTLVQFEDFGNQNAFRLLDEYKDKATCFNDDIQGTAAVALAGLIASEKLTGISLSQHTVLFYGAGEAGAGIADLLAARIVEETKVSLAEARSKIYMMDSKGLVTNKRTDTLAHHKMPYAHATETCTTLEACIDQLRPSVLIGVAAVSKAFSSTVLAKMAELNQAPVIFALSNPTSKAECSAEEAYKATGGRCVFASGSPFADVDLQQPDGSIKTFRPGQGNNAYIFPGLGLGALAARATKIDDGCLLVAASALADEVDAESLAKGSLYPPLSQLRHVSVKLAAKVAQHLHEHDLAGQAAPPDMEAHVRSLMYDPFAASDV